MPTRTNSPRFAAFVFCCKVKFYRLGRGPASSKMLPYSAKVLFALDRNTLFLFLFSRTPFTWENRSVSPFFNGAALLSSAIFV